MSIMRDMMESLDKLSVAQIQQGLQQGRYPAYLAIPAIELKTRMQKQFEQQQAMQQQPPQSTIAEQIMQEAQGVDQLPSNLPQEYAAGGIVAFGDGGEVERYQMGGAVAFSRGGHLRAKAMFDDLMREEQFQAQLDRIKAARDAAKASAEAAKTAGPAAAVAGEAATTAQAATEAAKAASGPSRFQAIRQALQPSRFNPNIPMPSGTGAGIPGVLKGSARLAGKLAGPLAAADLATSAYDLYNVPTDVAREYYGMQLKPGEEPSFMGDVGVRARTALGLLNPFGSAQEGITALMAKRQEAEKAAFKMPTDITRPDVMTGVYPSSGAGPGAGPGAGAAPAGIAGLGAVTPYRGPSAMDQTNKMLYGTEAEPGFLARSTARQAALDQRVKDAEGRVTGKAYEGLEKSLQKEEEGRGVEKDQAKAMAIFKAGLAMMAGTSPNAFENIGKGAMVGLDDYQKAAKDIKQAEKEHRRMMAQIEQARRAEDAGNRDRAIARLDKATEFEERRDQFVMSALNTAGGKDADRMFETWKLNTEGAIRRDVANIGAGATLGAAALRGKPRESDVTPQLRMQAMKMVDEGKLETDALASLNLKKMPKDEKGMQMFKNKVDELRERELRRIIGVVGGSFGSPAEAAAPSGFRYLGQE